MLISRPEMSAGYGGRLRFLKVAISLISRRVLLNLASNALKYTPKGSIALSLRELAMQPMDRSSERQRLIEFSMKDTGIGMSTEYKNNIFTPFSQENTFSTLTSISLRGEYS